MTAESRRRKPCDNLNHRRAQAPVRHCPACGGVVNEGMHTQPCSETQHAAARRQRTTYCVDCGSQLIFEH